MLVVTVSEIRDMPASPSFVHEPFLGRTKLTRLTRLTRLIKFTRLTRLMKLTKATNLTKTFQFSKKFFRKFNENYNFLVYVCISI